MAVTIIPNVTNWSVTPQNGQVGYFTLMNTWLSESTAVIASLQTAITAQNTANSEINALSIQVANDAIIATGLANFQGAWSSIITYSKGQSIESTTGSKIYYISKVDSNLNHSVTDTNYWVYNPINNKVNNSGNETIAGVKTFSSSPIVPTPTTSTQAANKEYVDTKQTNLGFTPVQQGTGIGQLGNEVRIGWSGDRTKITIDVTDMGNIVMDNDIGVANSGLVKTALNATGTAPIYACRAWVNFNGTGTVAIRASGNVSSITDNGVGDYTVNFTTAMPDANYSLSGTAAFFLTGVPAAILVEASDGISGTILKTISALRLYTVNNNDDNINDAGSINISIFR